MSTVEELQRVHAENLMTVLQTEMNMEASRQVKLERVKDPEERDLMEALFQSQREATQARIAHLKERHKEELQQKVKKLVRYKKRATKDGRSEGDNESATLSVNVDDERSIDKGEAGEAREGGGMGSKEKRAVSPVDFFTQESAKEIGKDGEEERKEVGGVGEEGKAELNAEI